MSSNLNWKNVKLKYLADMRSGESITSDCIEQTGMYPVYGGGALRGYSSEYTHEGNYVLIGRQGANCGNVKTIKGKFWASEHAVVVTPNSNVNIEWLGYLLESMNLNQYSMSAAQPGLAVSMIKNLEALCPPKSIQEKIAKYINSKVSALDKLLIEKERLIVLLEEKRQAIITQIVTKGLNPNVKMKDSGVEWIGEIPEHWEIIILKYLLKSGWEGIKIGPFGSALKLEMMADIGFKVYGQENLIKDDFTLGNRFLSQELFEELSNYEVLKGDVLVSMMGTIGKCKVVPEDIDRGIMDSHLIRMRFNENRVMPDYIALIITEAKYIKEQFTLYSKGSIMSGLNSSIIKSLNIVLPPIDTQKEILQNVEVKEEIILKIINDTKEQIKLLKEYRQSLIYEAVTGKIDVRDIEVDS